ncbi:polygalacturonase [Ziziphus jujuba]|uniref:Polygalacturonase n=1 Tax=Ziziphus jujuba TaxID=326968 RepID=A0A6P6G735_ZIZJJ|nr:polygalacturonase [Ziziphus jujuba]
MGLRFINFPTICFIFLLSFKVVNGDPADGVFNVKDFGALANGKNDDAKVAFLSASTKACNSNIAAKVLVPEGTYLVSLAKFQGPCKAPTVFEVHGVVNALPRLELIKSIKISAPAENLNTDGIHIGNSNGIEISSSVIGTGDDCVSLGQGSKNINIFDVFCGPAHGISVGSLGKTLNDEMVGLTVRNCTFTGTDNGVRIKTWPDCADGIASDFVFDDIVMNNVQNPIVTDQQYCAHNKCNLKVPSRIKASNVSFKRIRGISAS